MSLASLVLLLHTALSLLILVNNNPSLPQATRDYAQQVAQKAIMQAEVIVAPNTTAQPTVVPGIATSTLPSIQTTTSGISTSKVPATPAPSVSLTASPSTITTGQTTTLQWNSMNAAACAGTGFSTGNLTAGSVSLIPYATTTYTIVCTNNTTANNGVTANATVSVIPANTAQPAPTAFLTVSPATIVSGGSTTLSWNSTNATSCTGSGFSTGNATNGSLMVTPSATAIYSIVCTNSATSNNTSYANATVSVTPANTASSPPPATLTVSLIASPTSITAGNTATLSWNSTNALSCAGTNFSTNTGTTGLISVAPVVTTLYSITCVNTALTNNSTTANATITVSQPAVAAPTASLNISPANITAGQNATLTWSSTNAAACTGTGFATGNSTNGSVTVTPSATAQYSITCTNTASASATAAATVTVSTPVGPTVALLDSSNPMNWLLKSVCVNSSGNLLTADPYGGCPAGTTIRKLQVGEPLPYHNLHNINQLQQHDTIPLPDPSTGGTMVLMPFDFLPFNTYNLYDGTDGYDIYRVQGNWVTALNTSDGGGYGTTFFGSNCTIGGGWNFFPASGFLSGGQSTDQILGVYWEQGGQSFPGSCSTGYGSSINSWQFQKGVTFGVVGKPTKTMDAMISTHGFEPGNISDFKQNGHLEVFYFTKEYGITRWEVWTPIDQNPTKTPDCIEPDTTTYQGVTFKISVCRDWSTVTPATSAAIPLWPIPNINLLKYAHFDGGLDDNTTNLQLWHRFGKSPAGNLINWSLRNSTVAADKRYSSVGVRYLATNCAAGADNQCAPSGQQAIYQDIPISLFTNNATYGYGASVRTEGGTGTYQIVIQEINDTNGTVLWQDVVQDTNITSDNGPDQQTDQPQSAYLSTKFISKTVSIPILPGATKIRYLLIPVTPNTFDVLTSWFAPWPVATQNLSL